MITNHATPAQRKIGALFLDGRGWDLAPSTGRGKSHTAGVDAHIWRYTAGHQVIRCRSRGGVAIGCE
jgi:hypothetical protein